MFRSSCQIPTFMFLSLFSFDPKTLKAAPPDNPSTPEIVTVPATCRYHYDMAKGPCTCIGRFVQYQGPFIPESCNERPHVSQGCHESQCRDSQTSPRTDLDSTSYFGHLTVDSHPPVPKSIVEALSPFIHSFVLFTSVLVSPTARGPTPNTILDCLSSSLAAVAHNGDTITDTAPRHTPSILSLPFAHRGPRDTRLLV